MFDCDDRLDDVVDDATYDVHFDPTGEFTIDQAEAALGSVDLGYSPDPEA